MINRLISRAHCPRCGGREFIDHDQYGLYTQCLFCGHLRNLEKVAAVLVKNGGAVNPYDRMRRAKTKL